MAMYSQVLNIQDKVLHLGPCFTLILLSFHCLVLFLQFCIKLFKGPCTYQFEVGKPIQTKLTNTQVVTSFLFSARSVDLNTGAEETVALDLIDRIEVPVLYMVK